MKKNWINDLLEETAKEVHAWPEWMQRPEVRVATSGTETPPANERQSDQGAEEEEQTAPSSQDR